MLLQVWKYPRPGGTPINTPQLLWSTQFLYDQGLRGVMVLGLGGGLFGHMLFGMTDAITLGAKPGIFYWMLLGLITGLHGLVCGKPFADGRRKTGDGITFD